MVKLTARRNPENETGSDTAAITEKRGGGMSDAQSYEVGLRITHAIDYARSSGEDVRPHYLHTVALITDEVSLSDLTTTELVALKALLIPAHARVLSGRPRPDATAPIGKVLNIVRNDAV